ncbi:hypothetical protein ABZ319_36155 [Nocardia sp. NPDC005978]|uniref:hypothetical protein n=1 Tax=Nocardia sp. NPDC005978 TaxID=3156725 RepID=UPI0033AB8949
MNTRWKEWSDRGIPIPLLALATALAVVTTVVGAMSYRNWELSDRNDALAASLGELRRKEADCTAARTAGTDFLLAANNFDYRKPDEWTRRMAELTAGPVHEYFATAEVAAANAALITSGQLRKSATVGDAACAEQTADTVRVVAQLEESTQNFQTPDPVKTLSAVWVQVARVDGGWKAVDSGRGDQALAADVAQPGPSAQPEQPR